MVTVKEAFADATEKPLWLESMTSKNDSIIQHRTGTLVPPPKDDMVIIGMWCLVCKPNEFGNVVRGKSRWVCFGNHQEYPCHYLDTYSSVGRMELLKAILSMVLQHGWHAFQFNVETAFLYGDIDADVYIAQVAGFEEPGKENWVWKLNKSLYGTKQAPRCWRANFKKTLESLGMSPSVGNKPLFVNRYWHYSIKSQERPPQHLGYTLDWGPDGTILLHQRNFCEKILTEFAMDLENPLKAPAPLNLHHQMLLDSPMFDMKTMQKAVGMLIHLSINTRPDIACTVSTLSRVANQPTQAHWNMVKHLLRYLKGTTLLGVLFQRNTDHEDFLRG